MIITENLGKISHKPLVASKNNYTTTEELLYL